MQILKYLIIGGTAFLVEYGVFVFILSLADKSDSFVLIWAQTLSFCVGFLTSFAGNKLFTFGNRKTTYELSVKRQVMFYGLLAAVNLVLTNIFIYLLVKDLLINPLLAKIFVMAAVACWNYIIFQKVIFKAG